MASFFVTGASRGLGLEFVRQLTVLPQVGLIFASVRGESAALDEVAQKSSGKVVIVKLDVTDQVSIKKAAAEIKATLGDKGLDVLINNAGVCEYVGDGIKSMDNLQESFAINVMGVHWVTRELLPLLQAGKMKKVANMATTIGSISLAAAAAALPAPAYKISKTAMHALTVQYALEYEKEGFTFLNLCPGWLKTDLGGGDMADLTVEQGAKASLDIILNKGPELNGHMPKVFVEGWDKPQPGKWNVYDGSDAPW